MKEPEGYVYMQRGVRIIDVEKKDQRRYERQGWKFVEDINLSPVADFVEPPVVEPEPEITPAESEALEEVTEEKPKSPEKKDKPRECPFCGESFDDIKALIVHKRNVHQ
jgi:hypothetical protein